jgi:hypothetical protein
MVIRRPEDTKWRNIGIACILFSILTGVIGVMIYPIYREYDWDYDYLEENWFDTTKRPFNIHGLDEGEENEME